MRIAYADPPYVGQARKHYQCEEVDHAALIAHLQTFDAWALSCTAPSLRQLLPMCPEGTRIAAWVKPFAIYKPNVNPGYCWEPVLFFGTRKRERFETTVRDFVTTRDAEMEPAVSCNITLKKGLAGAKPEAFCHWLFDLLGVRHDDEFTDLFPGTGIVSRVWAERFGHPEHTVPTRAMFEAKTAAAMRGVPLLNHQQETRALPPGASNRQEGHNK